MMDLKKDRLLRQLGELAAKREKETDERMKADDALQREMQAPLNAEAKRRIVQRLDGLRAAESESRARVSSRESSRALAGSRARPWFLPSTPAIRLAAAATIILALGGLLFRGLYSGSTEGPGLSLPIYTLSVEGHSATERGPEAAIDPDTALDSPAFALGNRLTVALRPSVAASTPVVARLYTSRPEGWVTVDNAALEVSPLGGVRYEAVIGQDVAVDGKSETLMLVVAARGEMPRPTELNEIAKEQGTVTAETWGAWVFHCRVSTTE